LELLNATLVTADLPRSLETHAVHVTATVQDVTRMGRQSVIVRIFVMPGTTLTQPLRPVKLVILDVRNVNQPGEVNVMAKGSAWRLTTMIQLARHVQLVMPIAQSV
jgi:hypothetical protein